MFYLLSIDKDTEYLNGKYWNLITSISVIIGDILLLGLRNLNKYHYSSETHKS